MDIRKVAIRISLGVLVLFLLLVVIGFILPSHVAISRSAEIVAPPAKIYPLIADFKSGWSRWNTFDDEDPGIQYTFAGPEMGAGAMQKWTSKKMGDGSMTLVEADAAKGVKFRLLIGKGPFKLDGRMEMRGGPEGTLLTWTDEADLGGNPFHRLMGPLMGKMIGKSFETSLAGIKKIAETPSKP